MSVAQLRQAKRALGVLWIFAAACLFAPADSSVGSFGRMIFWLMLVAHMIECVVFWRVLKRTGRPLVGQIVQTLLFGVVHYQTIKKGGELA